MADPLIDLILGRPSGPHRPVAPVHLCGQTWRYVCGCGAGWTLTDTDAVWRNGSWRAPLKPCARCHEWIDGSHVSP